MSRSERPIGQILAALKERAKELNCLYRVDEILNRRDVGEAAAFGELVEIIPAGWQYPESTRVRIVIEDRTYEPAEFRPTAWEQAADVTVEGERVGRIAVFYSERRPEADEGPFLREERRLINAIAERIGTFLLQRRLRAAHQSLSSAMESLAAAGRPGWEVILGFLRRSDPRLLARVTRKMINHLCWAGVEEAEQLLQEFVSGGAAAEGDDNRPSRRAALGDEAGLTDRTFRIAASHCTEDELVTRVQSWIEEEKARFLMTTLENPHSRLADIAESLERFRASGTEEAELPKASRRALRVSLLRRLFTDRLEFINAAKSLVRINDFHDLIQRTIHHSDSQGQLGGKSAGLFLAAQVVARSPERAAALGELKVPRTWYIASDVLLEFMHYNDLEDLYNRKYTEIEQVRREYPHIVQVLKNSRFPPEIVKGLAVALDDFEDRPLIVRSSSLLEDRSGSSFSGKYKSLFLANQGSKKQRLEALQDAIAEVYASIFGPDPIEYRAERGLLDVHEEMGIMIQEVVGRRTGRYFFPAFAGVAFSHNEFRWSPRIRREDGLLRLVPGLGTRAVDRLADDYPVLVAPGQPDLRVNATAEEIARYSPTQMDVINLETNAFETVGVRELLRDCGANYVGGRDIVSIFEHDRVRRPTGLEPDWEADDLVVTFEGLVTDGEVTGRIRSLLQLLQDKLETPVDVEFASDGTDLYLLQCRAQSHSERHAPAAIPRNLPRDQVLFSANRYVANGRVPDITHIVYVDPDRYAELADLQRLRDVGRAVGRLNKLLPKRQFILMGPGRWGSRGDIRLGVSVTYSDINNTAALVEIARRKGSYVPELSFGTHFFQDLVEADIRYLPLYPDEPGILFNEPFLRHSRNILEQMLPEFAALDETLRVIDVPAESGGRVLRLLLNADLDEAVGLLARPSPAGPTAERRDRALEPPPEEHWRWRLEMAERLASRLDAQRYGVRALYVIGSTKNATAGPASDLDLIVHFVGEENQRSELLLWLEGWSQALAAANYLRTGYRADGLLDVHLVTDEDIAERTSFAAKIGAVTDAARPLPLTSARPGEPDPAATHG